MNIKKSVAWLSVGLSFGLSLGLGISALANKNVVDSDLPIVEIRKFSSALARVKDNYVKKTQDAKLITSAISGMISSLDPHSTYLDEDSFRELKIGTSGEFGGLGIRIQMEKGLVKVVSPIEDTPAFRAGIKTGDLIYLIDKKSVRGLSLNDAVKKMRGKPGTSITIGILRKKQKKPLTFTLVREVIKIPSVRSKRLDHDIGFLRITNFQGRTVPMLIDHISKLYQKKPLNGLVLDLRNDPGGLLDAAIGVSSVFLDEDKTVVTTNGRTLDSKRSYATDLGRYRRFTDASFPHEPIKEIPMVVLINGGSASASEIVAGALQDYKRAKIMGLQSFGKASVQTIMPLEDGKTALKITTAHYYTPLGRSIQVTGVAPDLWVAETKEGHINATVREVDFVGHLENPNNKNADNEVLRAEDQQKDSTNPSSSTTPEDTKPIEFGSDKDFQLQQAINFLIGVEVATIDPPKKSETKPEEKAEENIPESEE